MRSLQAPGRLAQALGLHTRMSGVSLLADGGPVWIEDRGELVPEEAIVAGPRIGVGYAGACADWPWRFVLAKG
jgi:3-methyladenine DNA glycosylase